MKYKRPARSDRRPILAGWKKPQREMIVEPARLATRRGRPRKFAWEHEFGHPNSRGFTFAFKALPAGDLAPYRDALAAWWRNLPQRLPPDLHTHPAQLRDFSQYCEAAASAIENGDVERAAYYAYFVMRLRVLLAERLEILGRKKLASDKKRGRRVL